MSTQEPEVSLLTMPFRAKFKAAILSGQKTATSRSEKYGKPGDVLTTPFGDIKLTRLVRLELGSVRTYFWREEGCSSPENFERIWRGLHRGHFDPLKIVWVHRFELVAA